MLIGIVGAIIALGGMEIHIRAFKAERTSSLRNKWIGLGMFLGLVIVSAFNQVGRNGR